MPSVTFASTDRVEPGATHIITLLALDASGDPEAVPPTAKIYDPTMDKYWRGAVTGWSEMPGAETGVVVDAANMVGLYKIEVAIPALPQEGVLYVYATSASNSGKSAAQALLPRPRTVNEPVVASTFPANSHADTVAKVFSLLKCVHLGDQEIDPLTKKLIISNSNDVAAVSFNLKDATGLSSAREVWKKERA